MTNYTRYSVEPKKSIASLFLWSGLIVIGIFFGLILIGRDYQPIEKDKARDIIKLCWEEHERKSMSPENKLTIASVCEKFEADFLKRYGHKP